MRELYDSRNSHEIRISLVENNTSIIADHAKNISNKIDYFIEKINDKPINNARAIEKLNKCTDSHSKFIYMLLGMGVLITVVLIPIAIEVFPKIFK